MPGAARFQSVLDLLGPVTPIPPITPRRALELGKQVYIFVERSVLAE